MLQELVNMLKEYESNEIHKRRHNSDDTIEIISVFSQSQDISKIIEELEYLENRDKQFIHRCQSEVFPERMTRSRHCLARHVRAFHKHPQTRHMSCLRRYNYEYSRTENRRISKEV